MAALDPLPDADELADVIGDLGAAIAAEYGEVEAAQVEAVADAVRSGDLDNPALEARLRRVAATASQALVPASLAAEVIAIATAAGLSRARAGVRAGGGRMPAGMPQSTAVQSRALVLTMTADLQSMQTRIERWAPEAYRTVSSMLTIRDHQEAVAWRYLSRGITGKTYRNGARMPIGSYAEMLTRTMTNQAATIGAITGQQAAGFGLVQISVGSDACSSCAANRGKVFSVDGRPAGTYTEQGVEVVVAGPLSDASSGSSHYRGPNCRCVPTTWFGGVPAPGSAWNPQAEAERDRQRALERHIREWKLRETSSLTDAQRLEARRRVRHWQSEMRTFLDDTGRVRNRYREQLAFAHGPAMPSPPPPAVIARGA